MEQQKTWEDFVRPHLHPRPEVDEAALLRRLQKPQGPVDVVLDTDTYNEVDDQYALAYLVSWGEKLRLKAVYAAPFHNQNAGSPRDGMEKSYREIQHILRLMGREDLTGRVYQGATAYLQNEKTPALSPASLDLAQRAMDYTPDHPLYVVAIGAITNVASALLQNPAIRDRVVIVWLGGNALDWPDSVEFNLFQDIAAARVVFGSGAAVVQLPCMGVVSAFTTSGPELCFHLKGKNPLCDYLVGLTCHEGEKSGCPTWTRAIWDVTAVAWLLDGPFMEDRLEHIPLPGYDDRYARDPASHLYRYVYHIHRDALFADLFQRLAGL